jgi:hypothetical protein
LVESVADFCKERRTAWNRNFHAIIQTGKPNTRKLTEFLSWQEVLLAMVSFAGRADA